MRRMPPPTPQPSTSDPLLVDRHWRSAVLWTLRDLKGSIARQRTLSLPNLCRIFERRWHVSHPPYPLVLRGRQMGRAFISHYYLTYQPFRRQEAVVPHNGHCGG